MDSTTFATMNTNTAPQNLDDFEPVMRKKQNKKQSSANGSNTLNKMVIEPIAKALVVKVPGVNRRTMSDIERLEDCRSRGISFEVRILSEDKQMIRSDCGLKTDHQKHRTEHKSAQVSNATIIRNISNRNIRKHNSKFSYSIFAAHTAIKINNVTLLDDIVKMVIGFGMTMDEIMDARYGDDAYNLLNMAAWNNALGCLKFCIGRGADISFINKRGENIYKMLENGCHHLTNMNPQMASINEANYRACDAYINGAFTMLANADREEDLSTAFKFTPSRTLEKRSDEKEATKAKIVTTEAITEKTDETSAIV